MYSIVVVTPGMEELPPSVVTLQRSSIAVAKKFLGQLRLSRVASYGCKYIMTSVKEEGPSGSYYNYKFTPAGFVTNEEEFSIYKSYHESLREMGLRLRDIDMESDPIGPSSNEDPGY